MESAYVGPIDSNGKAITIKNNKKVGVMIFDRGDGIYCGEWKDGRYHGYGKY